MILISLPWIKVTFGVDSSLIYCSGDSNIDKLTEWNSNILTKQKHLLMENGNYNLLGRG